MGSEEEIVKTDWTPNSPLTTTLKEQEKYALLMDFVNTLKT